MSIVTESHYATVDGVRLHYQVAGKSNNTLPIIFTHGGGPGSAAWSNFRLNAAAFNENYQCLFVDLPQFGGSDRVAVTGPVWSWHAKKLAGLMDALGIAQAHFINQSFGGGVALKLALNRPELVASVIAIGAQPVDQAALAPMALTTKHVANLMGDYFFADGGPSLAKMRQLIQRYELHNDDVIDEETVRLRFAASDNADYIALLSDRNNFGQPENLLPELHKIQAPVLLCWGLHDWFGAADVPLMMLNRLPNGQLHVFGSAAHHLQTELPQQFNAVALAFLATQATRVGAQL